MEKYHYRISTIIANYIKGECNESELQHLQSWIDESQENKKLFESLLLEENFEESIKLHGSYDLDKAYQNIVSRQSLRISKNQPKKRISLLRVASYAAAILLPVLIVSYFLFDNPFRQKSTIANQIIEAGTNKAELHLASGERIILDKEFKDTITNDNVTIQNNRGVVDYKNAKETRMAELDKLVIPRGGKFNLVLADGTKVWLNSESEITFPQFFSDDIRKVKLKGEAYFEVTENKSKPFIVEVGDMNVKVLGTSFNIRSYNNELHTSATLVEGKVEVSSIKSNEKLKLSPGDQARYVSDLYRFSKGKVDVGDYIAWKDGLYIFRHKRMEDVMLELERWYDVKVVYNDESVKDRIVTGRFKRDSDFLVFVEMMELTEVALFTIKNRTISIE